MYVMPHQTQTKDGLCSFHDHLRSAIGWGDLARHQSARDGLRPPHQSPGRARRGKGTCKHASNGAAMATAEPPPAETAETDYVRFKQWISDSPDDLRPELAQQLLYPVFVHLYIDLIVGGKKAEAHR